MMKVLMLGWELPPHNSGGLGVACLNLARSLSSNGADIDFLIPYNAEYDKVNFNIIPISKCEPLTDSGIGSYDTCFPKNEKGLSIRDIQKQYCSFVKKYLSSHHPDIIHAHDWLTFEAGMLAKQKFGIPLIAHVHATEYDRSGMHGGNRTIHRIEQNALNCADRIIAVSEATKKIIHEKYQIPLSKIEVLHNSLDESFLNDDYTYDENDYNYRKYLKLKGYTIISTVGRFTIQKGLNHIISAAAKALKDNKKLMFVFAGDGEERNSLIDLASSYGISRNVLFTGFVRGTKLRDIYELSDVFIMSSISEPFGLTALEAAHHGDALIITKQSGVSEVIKSALSYDFWDEAKLVDEIIKISSNPVLRDSLKNNAKKECSALSWDEVAKKCLSIYDGLKG